MRSKTKSLFSSVKSRGGCLWGVADQIDTIQRFPKTKEHYYIYITLLLFQVFINFLKGIRTLHLPVCLSSQ